MKYLKEEALNAEEIEDFVPYEKKTRGKVWKPKEKKKTTTPLLPDDLSDVLDTASEDDLIELAGSYYSFCRVNYCFVSRKHPWTLICCSSLTSLGSSLAGSSCCNLNETILKKMCIKGMVAYECAFTCWSLLFDSSSFCLWTWCVSYILCRIT